jgi:glucose/arabinose dehydrogenase
MTLVRHIATSVLSDPVDHRLLHGQADSSPKGLTVLKAYFERRVTRTLKRWGMRGFTVMCTCTAALGCAREAPFTSVEERPPSVEITPLPACGTQLRFEVDTLLVGLDTPWDIAFTPDGGALITERGGTLRRVDPNGRLSPDPVLQFDVHSPHGSEIGLLGIDVSPDGRHVYLAATYAHSTSGVLGGLQRRIARMFDSERGQFITFSVHRIPLEQLEAGAPETILKNVPAGFIHGGGTIRFGPDGLLYVTNGDAGDHWWAQDKHSLRGKVLRLGPDGSIPKANPSPESPVYASGIRSSQGLAWFPGSGALLLIDHGPSGLESEDYRTGNDELNVVRAGDNLGWPLVAGGSRGGNVVSPIASWTPAIAPAGLTILPDPSGNRASALITGLAGGRLTRVELALIDGEIVPTCEETYFSGQLGRLRLVRTAPDGTVWLGTSNRDGRGTAREGGDHILRLSPAFGANQ